VGIDIARALLAAGAQVSALVRSGPRAEALGTHERLRIVTGFPNSEAAIQAATGALAAGGPIDGAVASLGPWFQGPAFCDLRMSDWTRMVEASLTSHYVFARSVFPLLGAGSQYVMVNGGAALAPVPHSGVVSILARAQLMMGEVLAAENPNVGVHTLMLQSVIATRARTNPDPAWVTSAEVGRACAWLFTEAGRLTSGTMLTLTAQMRRPPTQKDSR
jgi:NAD(P)-dependent dehydrogenase (short-subunit alcohol dehydrogenase family)